ncbi:hypothetical protein ACLOAU_02660 [Niabella sp. CJ426]|uniref:hypothetical protein n=1 Tax=Niabella sp. CJ426 TaxID=3393740 RepID=UPI003D070C83
MNKFLILGLLIVTSIISCKKNDNNPQSHEKKVLLARTNATYTYDGSTMITEYTYDDNGRIISELENKGTSNEQLITYTYDSKGNIAAQKFPNRGSLRIEYTYDNQNRMTSSQKYSTDGSMDEKRTYTYFDDRIEEVLTYKSGNSSKRLFTYAADKKDIANFKLYTVNGRVWVDNTYTYTTIKDPKHAIQPLTPYTASIHLMEKAVTVDYDDPANIATYTYTYTYVANANGYPTSRQETSNGTLSSTTTYEYIIK